MLRIDATSSLHGTEGNNDSVPFSSVSLRKTSLEISESQGTISAGSCNLGAEDDESEESDGSDIFPLELLNSCQSTTPPTTDSRELVMSASMSDLSQSKSKKAVTVRRQTPVNRNTRRAARSVFLRHARSDGRVVTQRGKSEEIQDVVENTTPFRSREMDAKKRRDAMRRRSTRDLEHRACLIKLCTAGRGDRHGWSEIIECTSMLNVFIRR